MENRPKRSNEPGPSGRRTAANIERLREDRHLRQDELAQRVEALGRPMSRQAVSKTEKLDRRIDVDDLVAFAAALDVSPSRLLLPGSAGRDQVELLPGISVTSLDAWKWAAGEEPLPADDARPGAAVRFLRENRPHAIPDGYLGSLHLHRDLMDAVIGVAILARERGISLSEVKYNLDAAYMHAMPDDYPQNEGESESEV